MWQREDIKMDNPLRNFETVFSYYLSYHGKNDVETYKKIADITQRYGMAWPWQAALKPGGNAPRILETSACTKHTHMHTHAHTHTAPNQNMVTLQSGGLRMRDTCIHAHTHAHTRTHTHTHTQEPTHLNTHTPRGHPSLLYVAEHVKEALAAPQLPAATRDPKEKIRCDCARARACAYFDVRTCVRTSVCVAACMYVCAGMLPRKKLGGCSQ